MRLDLRSDTNEVHTPVHSLCTETSSIESRWEPHLINFAWNYNTPIAKPVYLNGNALVKWQNWTVK